MTARALIAASFLLAACSDGPATPDATVAGDAPRPPDARADAPTADAAEGTDVSCLGMAPPGGTGPTVVAGRVFAIESYDVTPAAGATVELRRRADDGLVGEATTAEDGTFSIATPDAVRGYFVVRSTGHLDTRAYADLPLPVAGEDALLLVASAAELGRWYADAGTVRAPGDRTVLVAARDCAFDEALDVVVDVAPGAGALAYYDEAKMIWDETLASGHNGFALLADTAASVTITPHLGATAFPPETLTARPDEITLLVVTPFD